MDDISMDNSLWFLDESDDLIEYSEGGLAEQIFMLADKKIHKNQNAIVSSIIGSSQAASELAEGMKKTQRLKLVFTNEIKEKLKDGTYSLMKKRMKTMFLKPLWLMRKGR